MAQRPSRPNFFSAYHDFERTVDTLIDDLLIARWRPTGRATAHDDTQVVDLGDAYEVRISNPALAGGKLDLEAGDRRLSIKSESGRGWFERQVDFPHPIDPEGATAVIAGSELRVKLPKKRARKIAVG
jgi:HSP20 family molecular chaperone IbpA